MYGLFNPGNIWVLIPLAAIIGSFIIKIQRIKANNAALGMGEEKLAAELRETIRRLETRVANLERAVTTAEAERKFAP
jgi:hypothetical protein